MVARYWTEFKLLFTVQALEQRRWWVANLVFTTLFPLVMVFGLGIIGSGQSRAGLVYVITGSTVVSLTTVGIVMVAQDLAWMKEQGGFLYYASLPISKASLLLAILASRLLLQLPGIAVALLGGSLMYRLHLIPNPLLLLILPLTALSLSGIGAGIGLLVPGVMTVNIMTQLVLFLVFFGAPVLIPVARLPLPLQWLGYLLPPTYAADGLRRAVTGANDLRLMADVGVLFACAAASLLAVGKGLRWRLR